MQMLQLRILPQAKFAGARREKKLQFRPGRHCGRATMARDHDCPARVAETTALLERLVSQPASQKAPHEGIARAKNVVHLDLKAGCDDTLFDVIGHAAWKHHAALRAALADNGCGGPDTYVLQSGKGVLNAAQDADFLFRTYDQIAKRQHILQTLCDRFVRHEAVFAEVSGG